MEGPRVVHAISGGIAACKAPQIVRALQQEGCVVRCILTQSGARLTSPEALFALTGLPAPATLWSSHSPEPMPHISLEKWGQVLLIAPATANFIAKMALGVADDLPSTHVLAHSGPIVLAPAMNGNMWRHPSVQHNLDLLRKRGVVVVSPEEGYLACGDLDEGRMAAPQRLVAAVLRATCSRSPWEGIHALVTAGPTREHLDPARFLSNPSTGAMGFALAGALHTLGARVTLIHGPSPLPSPPDLHATVPVVCATEMYEAVVAHLEGTSLLCMAAAVADFRPKKIKSEKIKKNEFKGQLDMEKNIDILKTLGKKNRRPYLVGFAAETENLRENALKKIESKKIDAIVVNDVSRDDIGFSSDFNQVTIYFSDGMETNIPRREKEDVALDILREIAKRLNG